MKRFILTVILLIASLLISACSNEEKPKPSDAFADFTKAWNKQDFNKMYSMLSDKSQKAIDEDKFKERYTNIYKGIESKNLKVTFDKPDKDKEKDPDKLNSENFTYHVSMDTVAGPLKFSGKTSVVKVKTKDDKYTWAVDWNPKMILKDLQMDQLVSVKTLDAERGEIVDRNEQGLAMNGKAEQIGLFPRQLEGHEETKSELAKLLDIDVGDIDNALSASWVTLDSFVPITTVSSSETKIIDKARNLTGVVIHETPARVYPCGEACAHLTGYVGTITKEQLEKYKDKGYTETSEIGKKGLELLYEDQLHGQDGAEITITDSNHEPIETIAKKEPVNGKDLKLTVDRSVQEKIYKQMDGNSGASAAINPKTGEVLALVSTPAFDPNKFALGISNDDYQKLLNDKEKPLLNRFTQTYAPGSTQKPISAAVALKNKTITPDTVLKINGLTWKDPSWKGDFHITREDSLPKVNLEKALVYSDNVYFAQVALKMGAKDYVAGLKDFGFGSKLPFPYAMEASQVANGGDITDEGLLANTSYGQGELLVNPLHMAIMYSTFVNDGSMIKPTLLTTSDNDGKQAYLKENLISSADAKTISSDLSKVVETPVGTAYRPQIEGTPPLAGKTGTAEYKEKQGTQGKDNGWFVAYNTDDPKLLISMMIENVNTKKSNLRGSHYVVDKVKRSFRSILK